MIGIYTCATEGYTYALTAQARRVAANLQLSPTEHVKIVLVTCEKADLDAVGRLYETLLPGAELEVVRLPGLAERPENYENEAQLLIAQMRTAAHERLLGCDEVWALDSDVLPAANSLRCMRQMLAFDGGWYSVAFCPYPSQGGGGFLSGHGTPQNPILPDAYEEEKEIPKKLIKEREAARKRLQEAEGDEDQHAARKEVQRVEKEIRAIPPTGNVFELNGKKWRRRGWFDQAYPGIGQGAVVPVDWIGFGNTLMNRQAAALCDWTGYDGNGTEDLYICFRRWQPAGLRICSIPHCPADHVIRKDGKPRMMAVSHEPGGEYAGHLRREERPWYAHDAGERFALGG